MDASGRAAIRAIVAMGVVVFILLMLASLGLRRTLAPNEQLRVSITTRYSPFDRIRAFEDLRYLAEKAGPRPSGSAAAAQAREYLASQLRERGVRTIVEDNPDELANVYAEFSGRMPAALVLVAPLSTPSIPEFRGANYAASASAWLLEMARSIKPGSIDRTLYLAWLDGEFDAEGGMDPVYGGSRRMIDWLKQRSLLENVQAVFYLGAIGDCHLNVSLANGGEGQIAEILQESANQLGYGTHFTLRGPAMATGPWLGIEKPLILLNDTAYGPSPLDHQRLWLTAEDTLEHVCPESLQAVADVFYHAVPAIEGFLNAGKLGAS